MSSQVLVVRLTTVVLWSIILLTFQFADPLFFLHHANLDRIWWNWQAKSLSTRLTEISGPTTYQGSTQVTLAWNLVMGALGSTLPIKSVMDVRAYPMCYNYV